MKQGKTIGEVMEDARISAGAQEYAGHGYMDLMRFDEATQHMIIFDVLSNASPVGSKGERMSLFLSDAGYENALASQQRGEDKIINHAKVVAGHLYYDHKDRAR